MGETKSLKKYLCGIFIIIFFQVSLYAQQADTTDIWELSLAALQDMDITTASMFMEKATEAPSIITVITAREIKNIGAKNLEEAIRGTVGLDIIAKPFQPLSYIGVRGLYSTGSNNKIKIMLDGHMLQSVVGDPFFHINHLPVENIKQIEIIRGPGSALYGTNAFIGVLNIITKDSAFPSKISVAGGSYNTLSNSAEFSFKKKKLKTHFYADYKRTNGPSLLIESDVSLLNNGELYSAAPGKTTEFNENYTFQTNLSYGNFYFNGFYQALTTQCAVGVFYALTDEDEIKSYIGFGEMGYKIPISKTSNIRLKAYYDYYYYDGLYETQSEETAVIYSERFPENPYPEDAGVFLKVNSNSAVFGSEMTFNFQPISSVTFLAGASYEFLDQYAIKFITNANLTGSPITFGGVEYQPFQYYGFLRDVSDVANWNRNAERTIKAIFGQSTCDLRQFFSLEKLAENITLTVGLRYDSYDDVGSSANPRIGLVYSPTKKLTFKFLFGKSFRAPFFHELFQASNSVSFGNVNLKPENIYTSEIQVGYKFSKKLRGTLTHFNTEVKDLILRDFQRQYNNFGKIHSYGVEGELKRMTAAKDYVYLNATYQAVHNITHETIFNSAGASYKKPIFHPGEVPNFVGNIGFNKKLCSRANLNIAVNYVSARYRSDEKTLTEDGEIKLLDGRDHLHGRTLLSASILIKNLLSNLKGMEVQITGFNLLNTDHRDPETSGAIYYDIPRAGRHFMARLSYQF
jgi:outer membrane receptor for ferrienterochelin and colicins